jgi:hypothetical protein
MSSVNASAKVLCIGKSIIHGRTVASSGATTKAGAKSRVGNIVRKAQLEYYNGAYASQPSRRLEQEEDLSQMVGPIL